MITSQSKIEAAAKNHFEALFTKSTCLDLSTQFEIIQAMPSFITSKDNAF